MISILNKLNFLWYNVYMYGFYFGNNFFFLIFWKKKFNKNEILVFFIIFYKVNDLKVNGFNVL